MLYFEMSNFGNLRARQIIDNTAITAFAFDLVSLYLSSCDFVFGDSQDIAFQPILAIEHQNMTVQLCGLFGDFFVEQFTLDSEVKGF